MSVAAPNREKIVKNLYFGV